MKIRTAVFPVAGWGTRFLPATKAVPKELLPVVDRPVIQYAIEEAIASGIERVILVTSEHKRSIEDHFDSATDLEAILEERGGLGHAVLMARDAVGREPFAVVLPDDLIIGEEPALGELIKAYEASSASVVALMEVAADQTRRYGIVEPDPTLPSSDGGRIIPLRGLVEKPEPADAPSNLAIVGRYVLSPKIFETLERTQHGAGGEIQLTDAIQALAAEQPVVGYKFSGTRYDVGAPEGWLRANLDLALEHPTYGTNLRAALATHIRDGER